MQVKVHRKGVIIIPAEVRRKLNITENSYLELEVEGDKIVLRKTMTLLDAFGVDRDLGEALLKEYERYKREEIEKENSV